MSDRSSVIFITGACGDIGRSLAREFGRSGVGLALCDLATEVEAQPLVAELEKLGEGRFTAAWMSRTRLR